MQEKFSVLVFVFNLCSFKEKFWDINTIEKRKFNLLLVKYSYFARLYA